MIELQESTYHFVCIYLHQWSFPSWPWFPNELFLPFIAIARFGSVVCLLCSFWSYGCLDQHLWKDVSCLLLVVALTFWNTYLCSTHVANFGYSAIERQDEKLQRAKKLEWKPGLQSKELKRMAVSAFKPAIELSVQLVSIELLVGACIPCHLSTFWNGKWDCLHCSGKIASDLYRKNPLFNFPLY